MSSSNFKLSGINSLSYVGVQASTPPQLLYVNRAPTANDYRLILPGTLWLYVGQPNNTPIQLYMAATVIPNNATWILLYPASSGGAEEFVTDSGTATPSGGIINVKGGSNINTQATFPNNVIINLDSTVSLSGSLSVADNVTFTGVGEGVLQASILGAVTGSRGTNGQVLIGDTGLPPVWNNITSSDGSITITNGAGTINLGVTNGPTGVIITIFTSSGTWTPNSSTSSTTIYGFAGGGGGGSGQRNTVNASSGGGGGAPGGGAKVDFGGPVTTGPVSITIGAGGVGGAAVTTNSTLGNYGMNGGTTTVGTYYTFGYAAEGGQAGGGGGTTTATTGGPTFPAGAPGQTAYWTSINGSGPVSTRFAGAGIPTLLTDIFGNQANDAFLQTVPLIGAPINFASGSYTAGFLWFPGIPQAYFGTVFSSGYAGTPMGGGGGSGATTVPFRGGYGGTYGTGNIATGTIYITPANGGIQGGTINGTNGLSYTQTATDAAAFGPGAMVWGTGGGGGGGSNSGVAGNGGNGGLGGGGGGGGGGSVNGNNSGAGGTGGNGVVIIFEFL
jgi:hypothetical protein